MYVIASDLAGPVKLGISVDPQSRLKQLQTGHIKPLQVHHSEPVDSERIKFYERLLHRDNHHHRLRGEWFNMSVAQAISYVQFTIIQYDLMSIERLKQQFTNK